jgi:2-polyprenyl-3-methyl-5-hydroxy-6-metoxy-1,4-benzoquinol methylase
MNELKELFENGRWYHCFRYEDLISNGTYDMEQYLAHYKFENTYQGQTVLDVGCSDGYFSFWMKEHGALRVCAIDSNKYDGSVNFEPSNFNVKAYEQKYAQYAQDYNKFRLIYEKFGLKNSNKLLLMAKLKSLEIEYCTGTAYDLSPYGQYDLVLCSALLEHLRDPITAIEQLYFATKGKCIIAVSSAMKTSLFNRNKPVLTYQGHNSGGSFYSLSESAVIAMCKAAGFKSAEIVSSYNVINRVHSSKNRNFVVHAYK